MFFIRSLCVMITLVFLSSSCYAGYSHYILQNLRQSELINKTSFENINSIFTTHNYCLSIQKPEKKPLLKYDKSKFSYDDLYQTVEEIILSLPKIRNTDNLIKLIVETVIVESDGGYYFDTKNMGGLGIAQVNYKSAQYVLEKLGKDHKLLLKVIDSYKDNSLSLRDNLIHNVHFNLAMCVVYYYIRKGEKIYKLVNSEYDRAKIWKKVYNTEEGIGTTSDYLKRIRTYSD